jgi:hypothetical protein
MKAEVTGRQRVLALINHLAVITDSYPFDQSYRLLSSSVIIAFIL